MKIADASSARIWRIQRNQVGQAATASAREVGMYRGVSERIAAMNRTQTPADSGYYAEGRAQIKAYSRSFVDIREFSYQHSVGLQNARMTDEDIDQLILRMNMSHR